MNSYRLSECKELCIYLIDDEWEEVEREYIAKNRGFENVRRFLKVEVKHYENVEIAFSELKQMGEYFKKEAEKEGLTQFDVSLDPNKRSVILLDFNLSKNDYGTDAKQLLQKLGGKQALAWLPPIILLSNERAAMSLEYRECGIQHFAGKYRTDHESKTINFAARILAIAGVHNPPDFTPLADSKMADELTELINREYLAGESLRHLIREQIVPTIHTQKPVLILGDTGTGKELVARAMHDLGMWGDKEFISENCHSFAMTGNYAQSRLFGTNKKWEKAKNDKQYEYEQGLLRRADLNDLFLDEIVEMPQDFQAEFLRAVQFFEFRPVGQTTLEKTFFRLISATNKPIHNKEVARPDFLYRINRLAIKLPPLREHLKDILSIWNTLLGRIRCVSEDRPLLTEDLKNTDIKDATRKEVSDFLLDDSYDWPANVREIEFMIDLLTAEKNARVLPVSKDRQKDHGWIVTKKELEHARTRFLEITDPDKLDCNS